MQSFMTYINILLAFDNTFASLEQREIWFPCNGHNMEEVLISDPRIHWGEELAPKSACFDSIVFDIRELVVDDMWSLIEELNCLNNEKKHNQNCNHMQNTGYYVINCYLEQNLFFLIQI
jgi:hypothetical protein